MEIKNYSPNKNHTFIQTWSDDEYLTQLEEYLSDNPNILVLKLEVKPHYYNYENESGYRCKGVVSLVTGYFMVKDDDTWKKGDYLI